MDVLLILIATISAIAIFVRASTPDDPLAGRVEKVSPKQVKPAWWDLNAQREQERARQVEVIRERTRPHIRTLALKRTQKILVDDYGVVHDQEWRKELVYFWNNAVKSVPGKELQLDVEDLLEIIDQEVVNSEAFKNSEELDLQLNEANPYEYESLCARLAERDGWKCRVTSGSGDQGVDIICTKGDKTAAIQCKKYTGTVGNKAVQEINAGKGFYGAHYAAVVTNSSYTPSAKALANSLGVALLHHSQLTEFSVYLDTWSHRAK